MYGGVPVVPVTYILPIEYPKGAQEEFGTVYNPNDKG